MKVFLDLDDVLCDFCGQACKVHGLTREKFEEMRTPGQWNMAQTMGIPEAIFMKPIQEAGVAFWSRLEPLPWIDELIDLVEFYDKEWYVITAPPPTGCLDAYTGKVKWLKWYFGKRFNRFVIVKDKTIVATEGTVLIDDNEANVHDFRNVGDSRAIIFPTNGNTLHGTVGDELEYVAEELRKTHFRLLRESM